MTFVLGLTGSIGMGKSATAELFRELGVPVHDADLAVHRLYASRAVEPIEAEFPGVTCAGAVDRAKLGRLVIDYPDRMRRLEAIVHPLVREEEALFLRDAVLARAPLAVLDVPLLFETGGDARCDAVLVVAAQPEIQALRVLARPGMTPEKFAALGDKQLPDIEKRRRAHFIVDTGSGFSRARAEVSGIVRALAGRPGRILAGRLTPAKEPRPGNPA